MTAIIGLRTDEAVICGCCGRAAGTIGAIEVPGFRPVLWCCDACNIPDAFKVMSMNTMKLDAVETAAIRNVADEVIEPLTQVMMGHLWQQGVRDLAAVSPDQFAKLVETMKGSKDFAGILAFSLVTYSNEIRKLLVKEKAQD